MKTRSMIFVFGATLMVSFGVLSSVRNIEMVRADEVIDIGALNFKGANGDSIITNIYGIPTDDTIDNPIPGEDWASEAFHPADENSGTFINNVRVGSEIKKLRADCYYIAVTGASVDSIATVKGTWINTHYKFTIEEEFNIKWTGSSWMNVIVVPELETYDTISLADTCFDDIYQESFGTTSMVPSEWNTYVPSVENTTNSFAFQFRFESFGNPAGMKSTLDIKVGTSGAWDEGHFYQLSLINSWGGDSGGQMLFKEIYGSKSSQIVMNCNLNPGQEHLIEFASIYAKGKNQTYDYVKYDGELLYEGLNKPFSSERSTKVSYNYSGKDVNFLSTTSQKENEQVVQYGFLNESKEGIYLNAEKNNIPADWENKGAPVSKYNALLNGKPMYAYGVNHPLAKCGEDEQNCYYLDLKTANVTLKEGDVITLSGEFRFYFENQPYSMVIAPVSFLYSKNQMSEINIHDYLYGLIKNHCDLEYYDDDKIAEINTIVEGAKAPIKAETKMHNLWNLYFDYIADLDAIPYSPEKAKEILDRAKEQAVNSLNAYVDSEKYLEEQLEEVRDLVNEAVTEIEKDSTDSVEKVNIIVENTVAKIEKVETKLQYIEKTILASSKIEDQYLADYEVVTTSDLDIPSEMLFGDKEEKSYRSGNYEDITTRIPTSSSNTEGNMVFQFTYESDKPSARCNDSNGNELGAQIFIRMRGTSDTDAYRFDIATITDDGEENAGVALAKLVNDVATERILYNAHLKADTKYKFEVGALDIKGYDRTFLFMKVNSELVLKTIVDKLDNPEPTIAIRDSYVSSPYMAKITPIEEKTTRKDYSTLLGRMILDEAASKEGVLVLTLRENDIPTGEYLYPSEMNSFTLNNEQVPLNDSYRPASYIQKTADERYLVIIEGYTYQDGDSIHIGGYYTYFASQTNTKSVYRLFDTTLIYHEENDTWEQIAPTDPETIIYEAKETISHYVDLANYSQANAQRIEQLVAQYVGEVDLVDISQVPAVVSEALEKMDAVPTLLDEYKASAKSELASYRNPDDYRQEEKNELNQILEEAYAAIDEKNENSEIDIVVSDAKAQIDALKTASQRDAEDLADAKRQAKNDVDAYFQKVEMKRYNDANVALLTDMTYDVYDAIDAATSIEEVNSVVSSYKEAVKAVKTKDGSTFDGEKYIEKPKTKKGCSGSIETVSTLSFVALFGAALLIIVKKIKEN